MIRDRELDKRKGSRSTPLWLDLELTLAGKEYWNTSTALTQKLQSSLI